MTNHRGNHMNTMMQNLKYKALVYCLAGLLSGTANADANFVHAFNQKWAQHDAIGLLEFVENAAATNPCLDTVTAKGLVYGIVITRGVTATNLFEHARLMAMTSTDPVYSEDEKKLIGECVQLLNEGFVATAALGGGALEENPSTNASYLAELFEAFPDKPMFADCLEIFSTLGTPPDP